MLSATLTCACALPLLQCGEQDPDIFFTDRPRDGGLGHRNKEYLSIWADDAPGVLCGRTPLQCYEDFMASFRDNFLQVSKLPSHKHASAIQELAAVGRDGMHGHTHAGSLRNEWPALTH